MAAPIGLRDDFDAARLRGLAKASRDPDQLRRLLSLAEICDGGSRGDAARIGGVAVVILDQAGWHGSKRLQVPDNITLLPLPPRSPELNPVENVWQFIRDNWLSNRVFKSYADILDHCCYA